MARGKTLRIYLAADLKNFNRGMGQAKTGVRGLGDSVSKYLGPALIGAAAAAGAFAVKIGVDAVSAASDLVETQNKVSEIFGDSSDQILKFGETAVTALGQTATEAMDASATFAQFGMSAGIADQELVDFSTDLVTLASDLASFNNTSPEQAVDAIGSALRGSSKPLRAYGILLDDAKLRQEALNLGISDGTSKLTASQKVLAANAVIFKESTVAQGDFSRTSEGLANTTRILSAAMKTASATIGESLVEALESATASMGGSKGLADKIEETGQGVSDLVVTFGSLLSVLQKLVPAFEKVEKEGQVTTDMFGRLTDNTVDLVDQFLALLPVVGAYIIQSKQATESTRLYDQQIQGVTGHLDEMRTIQAKVVLESEALARVNKNLKGGVDVATKSQARQVDGLAGFVKLASQAVDETEDLTAATGRASKATETLTKWEVKAAETQKILQESEGLTAQALDNSVASFMSATQAVKDYASAIQGDLLSGIDLGAAFEGQIGDAETAGVELVDAFNKQIEQANYFGTVLNSIKAQGADKTLVDAIASLGPETGAALGEQMILEGLIPSINEKWVGVQDSTAALAQKLVPEFMTAGVDSAAGMVTSLATQLQAEQKTLKKLGKNMAKPVGAAFKSRLAKDVADAVRNVEAAATAARAEKVADATSRQAMITDQAVAMAFQSVFRRADARSGAQVQPVLT